MVVGIAANSRLQITKLPDEMGGDFARCLNISEPTSRDYDRVKGKVTLDKNGEPSTVLEGTAQKGKALPKNYQKIKYLERRG